MRQTLRCEIVRATRTSLWNCARRAGSRIEVVGQELQRDGLAELEIVGAVDLAHAAAAERRDDAEAAGEERAGGEAPPAGAAGRGQRERSRVPEARHVAGGARQIVHRALALVGLRVVDRELLERGAGEPERGRFGERLVGVPVIDDEPLDHPHRAGAVAGGAVDVGGLVARRR